MADKNPNFQPLGPGIHPPGSPGPRLGGSNGSEARSRPASRPSSILPKLLGSAMFDAAPDGVAVVDDAGRVVLVNRWIEELFGYPTGELLGASIETLVPHCLRKVQGGHRRDFVAEDQPRTIRTLGVGKFGVRRDGTRFPVDISLNPLQMDGSAYVVVGIRDDTERFLREEEDRTVRDLLDATTDVMVISERDSLQVVYVNQGAIRQLRYSKEELLAMTAMQLQPGIPKDDYREIVDGISPGQWVTYTTAYRRKDGSEVDVEVTLGNPKAAGTASPRLVSVARDISKRVQAERRLRQAERDIAVFDERERIARDLHDSVIQRLFAAGLAATSIIERISDEVVRERVDQVVNDLDATIHDLRASIFELAPLARRPLLRSRVVEICSAECDVLQVTSTYISKDRWTQLRRPAPRSSWQCYARPFRTSRVTQTPRRWTSLSRSTSGSPSASKTTAPAFPRVRGAASAMDSPTWRPGRETSAASSTCGPKRIAAPASTGAFPDAEGRESAPVAVHRRD